MYEKKSFFLRRLPFIFTCIYVICVSAVCHADINQIESSNDYGVAKLLRGNNYNWFPKKSKIGEVNIVISKSEKTLYVYSYKRLIGISKTSLGSKKSPTPTGKFYITNKVERYFSKKYNDAIMPYSLFINDKGVAIHAGDFRSSSAGCIKIPSRFAANLFLIANSGTEVLIQDQEVSLGK